MNAETNLHRLQIEAKNCVAPHPSWNRAETGRVSHLAGGQSRDEDGLWCLQWSGWIHFFCESTRSFKCQEIESAFSFRHLHHHHDSHSEEDWNHVMNSKKKKKWRCFCGSSGDCQTLVLTIVGSNPAWSLAQQASYLQKKAKLTKAATFSIVQVFLRVAEHRGKIHASQPASLDLILGVPFTHLLSGIAD